MTFTTRLSKRLAYILVGAIVLGGGAIAATSGTVPLYHDDPLNNDSSRLTPEPTQTPHPTATSTDTQTTTATPTVKATEKSPPSQTEKYTHFRRTYVASLHELNVDVLDSVIYADEDTLHLTYKLKDPSSSEAIGDDERNVSLLYVATVDTYRGDKYPESDETWIPKQLNITAKTPSGQVYLTGHMKYEWAVKMSDGDANEFETMLQYYNTTEYGPGHPDHGE